MPDRGVTLATATSKTIAVAWREFKSTALTKAFLLAAVVVPAVMIGLAILGPLLFSPQAPPLQGTLAIVDPEGELSRTAAIEFAPEELNDTSPTAASVLEAMEPGAVAATSPDALARALDGGFDIDLTLAPTEDAAALPELKEKLRDGTVVAILTSIPPVGADDGEAGPAYLYVPSAMNVKHTSVLERAARRAIGRMEIDRAGLNVETVRALSRTPDARTIRVSKEGREAPEGEAAKAFKAIIPMAFMMLMWMGAFVSSNYLLTTTIEEKSNKVMEVLLSAVSPMQLMSGKIIGQGLVGLVMLVMYAGLSIAALVFFAYADLIQWTDLLYLALYYVMGYFMVASIMAAIGSAVNELREAQSLMTPAMMLLMVPLLLWLPISDAPNGTLATVTSFIPPLIPFVMILRITGTEAISLGQILASLVVGYAAMLGMIWLAAKIFRVGVLMSGKPPSPLELLRWVRYE